MQAVDFKQFSARGILLGNLDANDPPIGAGMDIACGTAGLGARAHTPDVSRRATGLQRISIGFAPLKDLVLHFACLRRGVG